MPKSEILDPRAQRTRLLIENALLELFDETTLQTVTISQITKQAGVNRATFYAHYTDKYNLFSTIIRKTFQQTLSKHLSNVASCDPTVLRRVIDATCEYVLYLNSQCPPAEREIRPLAETEIQTLLEESLVIWLHDMKRPSPDLSAAYISWAIFGTCLQWIGNKKSLPEKEIPEAIYQLSEAALNGYTQLAI